MSAVADTLRGLKAAFEGQGVAWYVFGAQAVAVRGAPRATQDIDVTVLVPRDKVASLVDALESHAVVHRYPELARDLLNASAVLPMRHSSGMEVDVVLAGSGLETLIASRATLVDIDGVATPVASATDLVVMKALAGRGKDIDDIASLLASGDVDVDEARDLLRQLEEALEQSDLVPLLDRALDETGPVRPVGGNGTGRRTRRRAPRGR